jgi:HD-GYP domain-containing protein (c-di-GMP phosphodiesterase class II)
MPALFIAGSVAFVLVDQIGRSEPVWSEWWLDLPLAGLLSGVAWLWWRSRARSAACPSTKDHGHAGAIDDPELALDSGVEAMAAAVDMRDQYTGAHSEEVVRLARRVGEHLGLTDKALSDLAIAARLHDVGKIGVPDAVLLKDGPLEGAEWEIMRRHPEWGAQLLSRVPGLRRVARIVRHAHERWDGQGYPDRLRFADIPLESRIIFACDAYDAMTSDRPYRAALRPWIAVSELREGAGGQFDPDVVDVLVNELRTERSVATSLFQQAERVPAGVAG